MEEIVPTSAHKTQAGVFLIDQDHVERIIDCIRRYLPDRSELEIKLTLVGDRAYKVNDVSEIEKMPFDIAKELKEFVVAVKDPEMPWPSINVNYELRGNSATTWCHRIADMHGAVEATNRIVKSKIAWYNIPYRYAWLYFGIIAGFAGPLIIPIKVTDVRSGLLAVASALLSLAVLYLMHRFLFARNQIMFGAEGKRERNRQVARKAVAAVTVTLIGSWIAGGYLRKGS